VSAAPPKLAPAPAPASKATTLAEAFNFASEVSPTAEVPPLPGAAAATDDIFDFQPIDRGGAGSSSGMSGGLASQSMCSGMRSQPLGPKLGQPSSMALPKLGQPPAAAQSDAGFGDFGDFSPLQVQQHPSLGSLPGPPKTAQPQDSAFDSLI
jgi:hypothetical protein